MEKKAISRNYIAKLAGVSGATVSYALSEKEAHRVNKETRERILKIANELGYKPFFPGRTLASGKSYNIGILLPSEHLLSSQHIMAIVKGIAGKMTATDYNLTMFFRNDMPKCLNSIESRRIDGLFIIRGTEFENCQENFPLVFVDCERDSMDSPNICNVRADHEKVLRDSINYFISKSCKNVLGIFQNPHSTGEVHIATQTFSSECARAGIFGATLKPCCNFSEQIQGMLKSGQKWDAFVINNECLSNLVVEALVKSGLKDGVDYHMIVYSTANQRFSCNSYRNKVDARLLYVEQENEIGESAWAVMEAIINGHRHENKKLVSYRLWEKPEKDLPCYWNSEKTK